MSTLGYLSKERRKEKNNNTEWQKCVKQNWSH